MDNKQIKALLLEHYNTYIRSLKAAEEYLKKTGPRIGKKTTPSFFGLLTGDEPDRSQPTEATVVGYRSLKNAAHQTFGTALIELGQSILARQEKIPPQIFPDKHQ